MNVRTQNGPGWDFDADCRLTDEQMAAIAEKRADPEHRRDFWHLGEELRSAFAAVESAANALVADAFDEFEQEVSLGLEWNKGAPLLRWAGMTTPGGADTYGGRLALWDAIDEMVYLNETTAEPQAIRDEIATLFEEYARRLRRGEPASRADVY